MLEVFIGRAVWGAAGFKLPRSLIWQSSINTDRDSRRPGWYPMVSLALMAIRCP
jgi:hypothetical protein